MKFILGKKLEMGQVFEEDGTVVPVTLVLVQPNIITQIKTKAKDGYSAIRVGTGKAKKLKKPQANCFKITKEFKVSEAESANLKIGDQITIKTFSVGDKIKVIGTSKGKGFQGVVKRHGFHGSPATHGHKDQLRMPGSIGAGGVQRVFKGMRMPGRMGGEQVTVTGLEVVQKDEAKNILYIKGAVPGARNGLLLISGPGQLELDNTLAAEAIVAEKPEIVRSEEFKDKLSEVPAIKKEETALDEF